MAFTLPQVPFKLTPQDMGVTDLTDALTKGIQLGYLPKEKQANLQKTLLDNLHQQLVNKYTPEDYTSTFASRYASANNANSEAALNNLKYKNPGLLGSDIMKDATVAQLLMSKGGQPAVDAHEQIKQAYPDAPLEQTVPLALQISQPKIQPSDIAPNNTMQSNVMNALMQQKSQQDLQQPVNNMTPLNQSLNNVLNPPQPQQQVQQQTQQSPAQEEDLRIRAAKAAIAKEEATANYYNQGGGKLGAGGKEEQFFRAMVARANPALMNDPQKLDEAVQAYKTGTNGDDLAPMSQDMSDSLNRIAKYGSDVATRRQQTYAATLDTLFNKADPNAEQAFKFSGAAGKIKGGLDQLISQVGPNDPQYLAYRKFVDQDVPAIVTEVVRTSGANSTNAQKATALGQAMPINLKTNPELAKAEWKELKSLYHSIGKTISKGVHQTQLDLNNSESNDNNAPARVTFIRDANGKLVKA